MSLWNRIPIRVMVRRASTSKASLFIPWNGTRTLINMYTHTHESTHERVRGWLLASLLPFLSLVFSFFFFTWATWRRVLTPGDSCEGSSARLSCVIQEWSFGGRGVEKKRDKGHWHCKEEVLVNESIPRISGMKSSLSLKIVAVSWPLNHRYSENTIQPGTFVNLFSLHFISTLSRISFTTNVG